MCKTVDKRKKIVYNKGARLSYVRDGLILNNLILHNGIFSLILALSLGKCLLFYKENNNEFNLY